MCVHMPIHLYLYLSLSIYIYMIYKYTCTYIYIYIYIERERERERSIAHLRLGRTCGVLESDVGAFSRHKSSAEGKACEHKGRSHPEEK